MSDSIYKGNPYDLEFTVQKRDDATGKMLAATGITDLHGIMSATQAGAAIDASLDVTLTERTGKPGTYHTVIPASVIDAKLFGATSYDNKAVFLRAVNADINVWTKVKAHATRVIA